MKNIILIVLEILRFLAFIFDSVRGTEKEHEEQTCHDGECYY